jgi:hypothetical protein
VRTIFSRLLSFLPVADRVERAAREAHRVARAVDGLGDARIVMALAMLGSCIASASPRLKTRPSGDTRVRSAASASASTSSPTMSFTSRTSASVATPSDSAGENVMSGFGWKPDE